jgi:hypothetical protein
MAIFARAFLYCHEHDVDFDVMAAKLGSIDWHLLACERSDPPQGGPTFPGEVQKNAQPLWANLLIIRDSGYRVSSTFDDVEATWEKIRIQSYRRAMVRGSGELLRPDRGRELRDASGCPLRDVSDGPADAISSPA